MFRQLTQALFGVTLLLCSSPLSADSFSEQQQAMLATPRAQLEQLDKIPAEQRTGQQWLLLSIGYDALNNKEQALLAVEHALNAQLPALLHVMALEQQALIYGRLYRNVTKALDILQQAEQAAQAARATEPEAALARLSSIYESFAQGYNQQGELAQAEHYVGLALTLAEQHQLSTAELPARLIAGRLMLQQNNYVMARQHFSRALELSQQLNRRDAQGSIHLRLGMAYQKLGDQPNAISHLRQAEQLNQQEQRLPNLLQTHITLAASLISDNALAQATEQIRLGEQLLLKVRDPLFAAQLKQVTGQLAVAQKDYQRADQLFTQAHQLFQQLGNEQFMLETALMRANNARQLSVDPASYLPAVAAPEQLPLYLQLQYWQSYADILAAKQDWQPAYQAVQQLNNTQQQQLLKQQRQQVDWLNGQVSQHKQQQSLQESHQQQLRQVIASALILLLLLQLLTYGWYRKRQTMAAPRLAQTGIKSWQAFVRQLKRLQASQPSLNLLAIQISQISEYKLQVGEPLIREQIRLLLSELAGPGLLDHTIHTDVIWLAVDPAQFSQQRLWQILHRHASQLPAAPAVRCWQGNIAEFLGPQWHEDAMQGMRELVWLSWQQTDPQQHVMVQAHACTFNSCEWSHRLIRQDLQNAIALGQIRLDHQLQSRKAA